MTVKFSRSIRSIQADNLVPVLVGIAFFTLLMIGWILWLFLARVPTYITSSAAAYHNEGYILAQFPPTASAGIRRGQPARFQLATVKSETKTIPLVVSDVVPETGQVRLILQVDLEDIDDFLGLQAGAQGEVKIAIRQDSPVLFVLRAAGLWPDG